MNFTPELTALQGVMISADNVNSFSKLTAKGGNEDEIEEVVLCVKNFLVKEKYANINSLEENVIRTTRKFAFYIILNADLKILESMVEKEGVDFLIWTIPTVPKCLMCELLWKLDMGKFVNEVIAFCCPELGIEIAESLTNHMKYISPMESAEKLKIISGSCYKLICRLNFFNTNEKYLNPALSIFQKCLKYFSSPPNVGKLESLRRNQLYKYIGDTLYKILLLLYECFEEFNSIQKFQLSNDIDIYMLTYNEDSIVTKDDFKTSNCKDIILDCLHKCHESLLDILKELVMGVSVDIFCTWSELNDNGKSMQQTIGELCYKVRAVLMTVESVRDHPVVEMLQQISCKPIQIEDVINTTKTVDIIENINNSQDKLLWLQALLNKNDLFQDTMLIETITTNLNILKDNDFYKLYLKCIEHITNFNDNHETVKLLALKTFKHCDIITKQKILSDTFTNNCFSDEMKTTDFDIMIIEIFNKLIATSNEDLSDVLTVFIQSPKLVYRKIFTLATENAQQSMIMGRIMKYLQKYSNYYYKNETEPCMIKTLQEIITSELDCVAKQNNFLTFVKDMKTDNIISVVTLLLLVIMPTLHEALLNRKLIIINIQLKMLIEVIDLKELLDYRAPMLAMIAQVLEVVRWKIHTFNTLGPSCLELAIKLQKLVMDTYKNCIPEKESSWLKSKLKDRNPLNMYYYRTLWNPSGETYFEILTGIPVQEEILVDKLAFHLSQILPSTILDEWYQLWESFSLDNDAKLNIFHGALFLISAAEKDNRTVITWACLLHCYRNFILLTRHKYVAEPLSNNQVSTMINKIAVVANSLEEGCIEEFQSVVLPLLAYIAERKNDYTLNVPDFVENTIKKSVLTSLIHKLFSNEIV